LKFHPFDDRAVLKHIDAEEKSAGGVGAQGKSRGVQLYTRRSRSFLNDLGTFSMGIVYETSQTPPDHARILLTV
jgi:hypothetical protein